MDAIAAADREVYNRKQKVAAQKWKIVAEFLKASKPTTNYSQHACRNRFEALENETATIPPELDDNPEQREAQRLEAKKKKDEESLTNGNAGKNIATVDANAATTSASASNGDTKNKAARKVAGKGRNAATSSSSAEPSGETGDGTSNAGETDMAMAGASQTSEGVNHDLNGEKLPYAPTNDVMPTSPTYDSDDEEVSAGEAYSGLLIK